MTGYSGSAPRLHVCRCNYSICAQDRARCLGRDCIQADEHCGDGRVVGEVALLQQCLRSRGISRGDGSRDWGEAPPASGTTIAVTWYRVSPPGDCFVG